MPWFSIYNSIFKNTKSLICTKQLLYGFEFALSFQTRDPHFEKSKGSDGEHCILSFFDLLLILSSLKVLTFLFTLCFKISHPLVFHF